MSVIDPAVFEREDLTLTVSSERTRQQDHRHDLATVRITCTAFQLLMMAQGRRGWVAVSAMIGCGTVAFAPRFIVSIDRARLGRPLGLSDAALLNLDTVFLTILAVGQFTMIWVLRHQQRRNGTTIFLL